VHMVAGMVVHTDAAVGSPRPPLYVL
jgi:hypothetical protein